MTAHSHSHPHLHEHVPAGAGEQPFVNFGPGEAPVEALVLDIGDDVGALVLFADESLLGMEIELSLVGTPRSHDVHTMVRRRRSFGQEFIAGVYPELSAGRYTVWGLDQHPLGEVDIRGGSVTQFQATT